MIKNIFRVFIVVISALLLIWWLNIPFLESEKDTSPKIIVTTPILEDLVLTLLGPEINVKSLIKRGENPLGATFNKANEALLKHADFLIVNGSQVDGPYQNAQQLVSNDTIVINIKTLFREDKGDNPYYWMNIIDWSQLVYLMQVKLRNVLPNRRSELNYRMTAYSKEVYDYYQKIRNEIDERQLNQMAFATNHPSFKPFADLFRLKCTVIKISDNPTEQEINNIIDQLEKEGISTIIPNESISSKGIDLLVKESFKRGYVLTVLPQILTLTLDQKGSGVETYLELMQSNLRALNNG